MLVRIPNLLTPEEVAHCRDLLLHSNWVDGKVTAGAQSAGAKRNLQIPEDAKESREMGELILGKLGRNALFTSASLAMKVFPPLFNRYDTGMTFDTHIDNAIRFMPQALTGGASVRVRTDLSCTLFLTDPADYDGGELVVLDTFGEHRVKLPAGDMILYSASSRHHVTPVTRGSRWSSFFWVQSMVRDEAARGHLFELDTAIQGLRNQLGDSAEVVRLTGLYHNLLRRWADS
jgi:PKHD-type hydroxylase